MRITFRNVSHTPPLHSYIYYGNIFNNEMIYDENDKILKLYFLSAGGRERLLIIVSISKQFHSDIENI